MKMNRIRFLASLSVTVIAATLVACSGNTGGGEDNGNGTGFDPGDAGSLSFTLNDADMQVSESTGFIVAVKDASGNPVPDIRITCDTEVGLALIEPNDGSQVTDGGGLMSGRLGCEQIGSFRVGCRLPVGAGRREFATVSCRGPIPNGFSGFPNAGGGGLGGGSGEDPLNDDVRVVGISLFDFGNVESGFGSGTGDLQIDTNRIFDCDDSATTITPEDFFDTVIGIDVENFAAQAVNFSKLSFRVANSDGAGAQLNSAEFALINSDEVPGQKSDGSPGTKRFIGFMTKVGSAGKELVGASSVLPSDNWISNVTFRLTGVSTSGDEVIITKRVAIAFGTYDRCDG